VSLTPIRNTTQTTSILIDAQNALDTLVLSAHSREQPSVGQEEIKEAIIRLDDIFNKYAGWKDPVSTSLHKIRDGLLQDLFVMIESQNAEDLRIHEIVQRAFTQLNHILHDFYDGSVLEDPLLDGEQLWESRVLHYYQTHISEISPFTRKPFAPVPHVFAKSIIDWKKSLLPLPENPSEALQPLYSSEYVHYLDAPQEMSLMPMQPMPGNVPPEVIAWMQHYHSEMQRREQYIDFRLIIHERKLQQLSLQIAEQARMRAEEWTRLPVVIHQSIQERVQETRAFVKEKDQSFQKQIQENREIHQQEMDVINTDLAIKNQRIEIVTSENQNLKEKVTTQEARINQQNVEIEHLRCRVAQAASQVGNSNGGGGFCTLL